MMKKNIKLLIGVLLLILFPSIVEAEYAPTMQCDGRVYRVSYAGSTTLGLNGVNYKLNYYNTSADGLSGIKTYCMSPGKKGASYLANGGNYVCDRMIDPSGGTSAGNKRIQAFDVAVTKAYQTLLERGLTSVTGDNRVIGELIFRWLSYNYGTGDAGISYSTGGSVINLFTLASNGQPKSYWNVSDGRVVTAKEIYNIAVGVGNQILSGITYDELVQSGAIWGPNYSLIQSSVRTEGNLEYYTFEIDFTGFDAPSTIYWSTFIGGCENNTVKCSSTSSGSGLKGKVEIQVAKTSSYQGEEIIFYIDTNYYDIRSASSNILITRPANNSALQKMLIAIDGAGTVDTPSRPSTRTRRYPERTEGCEKQANGTFDYVKYKDGKEISRTKVTNESEMIQYKCPVYCTMRSDSVRTDAQYGWADAEHYGKLTYGNSYFFNKSDYDKYCNTTPNQNYCKHEGDSYTCKNGNSCSKDQFFNECCDQIDKDSDDYKKFCSCGQPEIEFVGACTEFNSSSEYLNNHVSDTPDNAQLKYCLFNDHNHDIANNSYEMKDQDTVSNNPYCRVSCIEEFDFKLPNAKYTMSGSYFTLGTEITGTRRCYVNQKDGYDGIDYAKFANDLKAAADRLAHAYNEYNKLNTGLDNYTTKTIYSDSKEEYDYSCNCDSDGKNCSTCKGCRNITNDCSATYYYNTSYTYTTYSASVSGSGRDISINLHQGSASKSEDSWHDGSATDGACNSGKCSATSGTLDGLKSKIRAGDGSGSIEYWSGQISTITQEINNIFKQYNDCSSGWENNFAFDPVVKFDYDEPYNSMINETFEKVETLSTSSQNRFCSSDVSDTYQCNNGFSSNAGSYSQHYFTCSTSGCQEATKSISNAIYLSKEKTESARFEPRNYFSIYTPSGTIALDKNSGTYLLYTGLCDGSGACLPIALNTNTGVFNFKFKFSNVGQYNDNNTNGRLIGQSNSVFNKAENEVEAGYVCHYINNCPECDYVCMGDSCEISQDNCDGECTYVCMNCLFDGNNNTFFYRTVSLNSLFPTDREHGYNWNDKDGSNTYNEKANYTIDKIHEEGENAYKEPEYSYELSPQQMGRIREYNKQVGGYLNTRMGDNSTDALHCDSRSINGKNYQNIVCYSAFLDTTGNTYFTELKRNDIWTLWPESGYFRNQNQYVVVMGIGPAWK